MCVPTYLLSSQENLEGGVKELGRKEPEPDTDYLYALYCTLHRDL